MDAYGNTETGDNATAIVNHHAYTGAYMDDETGLYYLSSRYCDPKTGSFTSADSYCGEGEGYWQLYAYCNSDPVNFSDLNGKRPYTISLTAFKNKIEINTMVNWKEYIDVDMKVSEIANNIESLLEPVASSNMPVVSQGAQLATIVSAAICMLAGIEGRIVSGVVKGVKKTLYTITIPIKYSQRTIRTKIVAYRTIKRTTVRAVYYYKKVRTSYRNARGQWVYRNVIRTGFYYQRSISYYREKYSFYRSKTYTVMNLGKPSFKYKNY